MTISTTTGVQLEMQTLIPVDAAQREATLEDESSIQALEVGGTT